MARLATLGAIPEPSAGARPPGPDAFDAAGVMTRAQAPTAASRPQGLPTPGGTNAPGGGAQMPMERRTPGAPAPKRSSAQAKSGQPQDPISAWAKDAVIRPDTILPLLGAAAHPLVAALVLPKGGRRGT